MSQPGWYPDPGGQPGMWRYWDGQAWSPTVSPTPAAPPPLLNQPQLTVRSGQEPYGVQDPYSPAARRRPWGSLIAAVVVVVALVVGGGFLLTSGIVPNPFGRPTAAPPPSNPTEFCPPRSLDPSAPPAVLVPGRIQGGKLSMPVLDHPWTGPYQEIRVPFGRDAWEQHVMLHENYDGKRSSWVASMLVGELVAGDGFFSPQQGSEIVSRCIMGEFYGDAVLTRKDRVNEATTFQGHDAWLLEMHLSFQIPNLPETGETAIILIVTTGPEASSIFYASIPDSRPDLLAQARQTQAQLRVES